MAKLPRFSRKYDFFLSDASNEEIVSISKELTEELNAQVRFVNSTALAVIGIGLVSLMLAISLIAGATTSTSGSVKSIIFLLRILSVTFFCISAGLAASSVYGVMGASSMSALYWRNVRETADEEKAYEQMMAVRKLNVAVNTSKNNVKFAVILLVLGGVMIGLAFLYEMLNAGGYI